MQQILVNLIALGALLFLARMIYRGVTASRRKKTDACGGCGSCEAAHAESAVKHEGLPSGDGPR